MISFLAKASIVTVLVVIGCVILAAVTFRIFYAFLPMILLWNMRWKAGR